MRVAHFRIKKRVRETLLNVYGINTITAKKIVARLGMHPQAKTPHQFFRINSLKLILRRLFIDFKLRVHVFSRIYLLMLTSSYRGLRHVQYLPTRGQRTHSNAKTPKRLGILGKSLPIRIKKYKRVVNRSSKFRKRKSRHPRNISKSKKKLHKLKVTLKITKRKKKKTTKKKITLKF